MIRYPLALRVYSDLVHSSAQQNHMVAIIIYYVNEVIIVTFVAVNIEADTSSLAVVLRVAFPE